MRSRLLLKTAFAIPFLSLWIGSVSAQQTAPGTLPDQEPVYDKLENHGRILGILPNYKTIPDRKQKLRRLTPKDKFKLATIDAFDWSSLLVAGVYAAPEQFQNRYPSWGSGAPGFGKRYAAGYADQAIGDYLTEAIFPSVLHEDPRYLRMATGGFLRRSDWALSRLIVTRTDRGGHQLNYSELGGNAVAAGISTIYYPAQNRTASDVVQKWGTQIVTDGFFNVLKEFWPDVQQKLFHAR